MYRLCTAALVLASLTPGVLGAQQASGELYGDFRYSFNGSDDGALRRSATANNASRLGYRGGLEGETISVLVDLQTGVNLDGGSPGGALTQRYYFVELRGGFGALALGRRSTAYKSAGQRLDPFYDASTVATSGAVPAGGLYAGGSFGLSNLTNGFADRTLAYTTPSVGGLVANAAVQIDPDDDDDLSAGVTFRHSAVELGVQHYAVGGNSWTQTAGVDAAQRGYASVSQGNWSLGVSGERVTAVTGGENHFLYASSTLPVLPATTLVASLGWVTGDGDAQPVTGRGVHAGLYYDLLPQTRLHALYSYVDAENRAGKSNAAFGLTYGFSLRPLTAQ
ncbi:MAG: porin [Gemmatimonadota bacterium]